MGLQFRSAQKEYLDNADILTDELNRNLFELDIINQRLGGYAASEKGLISVLKTKPGMVNVLDIGFGGGDFIKKLSHFAFKKGFNLFFYGVDLKEDCVKYAQKNIEGLDNIELICDDYRNLPVELLQKNDLIHCSLFLHHLSNEEIITLFKFARQNNCMVLANDLHRHWLAYYSIRILTSLFSRSYLVKNDAPI